MRYTGIKTVGCPLPGATNYGFFVREEVEPGVFITGIRYSQLILWLMALLLAERPPVA